MAPAVCRSTSRDSVLEELAFTVTAPGAAPRVPGLSTALIVWPLPLSVTLPPLKLVGSVLEPVRTSLKTDSG